MHKNSGKIISAFNKLYPNPKPFLKHSSPFELLVAVILSAQCTDKRVNEVTPGLFKEANTPEKMLKLGKRKLIGHIKSCGFFNQKARTIMETSKVITTRHNNNVPKTLKELTNIHGVGKKTASVVLGQAFNTPAFPVDTHVFRVAHRLGLSNAKTPDATDLDLRKAFPEKSWIPVHIQMISHGRSLCTARKPKCKECPLLSICPEDKKNMI
jgi:endonuclease III